MKISLVAKAELRESADCLLLPYWEGPVAAASDHPFKEILAPLLASGDFQGKQGEVARCYPSKQKEKKILLIGLGPEKQAKPEGLRRSYAAGLKAALGKKSKTLNAFLPKSSKFDPAEILKWCLEGSLLTNYAFYQLLGTSRKEAPHLIEKMAWIGADKKLAGVVEEELKLAQAIYLVRDLVNGNADDVSPKMLADTAQTLARGSRKLKTTLYDKSHLVEMKMGLMLAVNRASKFDPFLIQMSYRGNPKSKQHILLVGKGVTYDTGGLSLKPTEGMLSMKCDMAGAATVLGAVHAAAMLDLDVNVTALAPAVENAIDAKSYKVGDVYRSYSGKTVEVNNTDAEGRLILADALSFGVDKLKPTCIIDLATLTGNIVLALGEDYGGLFSSDDRLAKDLLAASERTGELLWRMPLHEDYKDALKSDIADLINTGGREAGAIKAALFLKEFVGSTSWAHLDIAGPAYFSKPRHQYPTKGTGYFLRLLVDFLAHCR